MKFRRHRRDKKRPKAPKYPGGHKLGKKFDRETRKNPPPKGQD